MNLLAHLKELCAAPGPSGYEAPVRAVIRAAWKPLAAEVHVDPLGSLWATRPAAPPGKRGKAAARPRVMLAAHMDTIGLMVSRVEGEFLRAACLGTPDLRVLPGQPVTVHGVKPLPGIIARPAPFLLPKNQRAVAAEVGELVIDLGLPADQVRALVKVGDPVTFAQPPLELPNGLLAAPGLDNRASVAALTVCLELLKKKSLLWDVTAVATVQEEELGFPGAAASAHALQPDLALVVDVSFGADANTRAFGDQTFALHSGPALGLGPNTHTGLFHAMQAAAQKAQIPHSIEAYAGHSGTDAYAVQVARAGIPTLSIGIPLRNMHTPVEIVALRDIQRTGELLAEFIAGLSLKFLTALTVD